MEGLPTPCALCTSQHGSGFAALISRIRNICSYTEPDEAHIQAMPVGLGPIDMLPRSLDRFLNDGTSCSCSCPRAQRDTIRTALDLTFLDAILMSNGSRLLPKALTRNHIGHRMDWIARVASACVGKKATLLKCICRKQSCRRGALENDNITIGRTNIQDDRHHNRQSEMKSFVT